MIASDEQTTAGQRDADTFVKHCLAREELTINGPPAVAAADYWDGLSNPWN